MTTEDEKPATSAEFKKHISKVFGPEIRKLGFKGSGFHFNRDTENFVFAVGIQGSISGPSCCAEFGIQPKIPELSKYEPFEPGKIKYYACEFRTRISPNGTGDHWWKYCSNPNGNIEIALEIVDIIKGRYVPIMEHFINHPDILFDVDVSDLEAEDNTLVRKMAGMPSGSTDIRLAWVFALLNENKNLQKAKEFSAFGLQGPINDFFGKDFKRILAM